MDWTDLGNTTPHEPRKVSGIALARLLRPYPGDPVSREDGLEQEGDRADAGAETLCPDPSRPPLTEASASQRGGPQPDQPPPHPSTNPALGSMQWPAHLIALLTPSQEPFCTQ